LSFDLNIIPLKILLYYWFSFIMVWNTTIHANFNGGDDFEWPQVYGKDTKEFYYKLKKKMDSQVFLRHPKNLKIPELPFTQWLL